MAGTEFGIEDEPHPASAKYQPGLVVGFISEKLHPAREQDAVAGPGWHLPVLSYRLRQSNHTQAGRQKPLMQIKQGLWRIRTMYAPSRSILASDACTRSYKPQSSGR